MGLASQESLGNVVAGILVSLFKPFDIGDKVILRNNNISGFIEDINLRHTIIRTIQNSRIAIPNGVISKELIENYQLIDQRSSNFIDVGITYESNVQLAKVELARIIDEHPLSLDMRSEEDKKNNLPRTRIYVNNLGDSSIILRGSVWTKDINDNFIACSDIREQILLDFKEKGIDIAYPTVRVVR